MQIILGEKYYSIKETAEILGVSIITIRTKIKENQITYSRMKKEILIHEQAIRDYIKSKEVRAK